MKQDKKDFKTEQRSHKQWNMSKQPNICITGVSQGVVAEKII